MARTVVVLGRLQRWSLGILLIAAGVYLAYAGSLMEAGLLLGAVVRNLLPVEKGRPGDSIRVVRRGTFEGEKRRRDALRDARQPPPTPPEDTKP